MAATGWLLAALFWIVVMGLYAFGSFGQKAVPFHVGAVVSLSVSVVLWALVVSRVLPIMGRWFGRMFDERPDSPLEWYSHPYLIMNFVGVPALLSVLAIGRMANGLSPNMVGPLALFYWALAGALTALEWTIFGGFVLASRWVYCFVCRQGRGAESTRGCSL